MGHLNDLHCWGGGWSDSRVLSWGHGELKPFKEESGHCLSQWECGNWSQGVQEAGSFVKTGGWDQVGLSFCNCQSFLNTFWSHLSGVSTSLGPTDMASVLDYWPVHLHPLWYSSSQSCYTGESPGGNVRKIPISQLHPAQLNQLEPRHWHFKNLFSWFQCAVKNENCYQKLVILKLWCTTASWPQPGELWLSRSGVRCKNLPF